MMDVNRCVAWSLEYRYGHWSGIDRVFIGLHLDACIAVSQIEDAIGPVCL
jgi:hypothetical protein